ncbi:hypothetical protein LDENG_00236770 [Lucifuga dentata]|nr:hypothetical protein LDENG_00236770 [Lucifuga dentata]
MFESNCFCFHFHQKISRDLKRAKRLKDHTIHFSCLSLIYSIFIHVTLLTIISQRIKPYFSFPDILLNLLIFQNQIFK